MAMMKYGRTTKMTSPPDKVVKNKDGTTTTTSGKTSVTMSDWIQPEKTPTPKNMISEEEYNASVAKRKEIESRNEAKMKPYNDAVAAYQQEQDDYASGMEQYKREIDFYNMGPELPKENPGDIKVRKGGKTRKGQDVTFDEADRYSAAQANAALARARKENPNIVDINDKSINPTSRKIWMEQVGMDISNTSLYGRDTGKRYVDREAINKIKSNVDVYGEDFDAREYRKAQESSDPNAMDKYLDEKGYHGRSFHTKEGMGTFNEYIVPQAPNKPTSKMPIKPGIEVEKVPDLPKNVAFNKLPTRKVVRIDMENKAKYGKEVENIEEGDWKDPTGGKFKRKGAIEKSGKVEAKGPKGAGGGRSASVNLSIFTKRIDTPSTKGGYGILRGPGSGEAKGVRAREEKMAKSFYAPESEYGHGGYYSKMEGTEGDVSKAIRSDIKDMRSERRDWKKQTSLTGAEKRAGSREMFKEDIKTGRLSARYAKRGDLKSLDTNPLDAESGGVWKAGQKSKLKIYTPDLTKSGEKGAMDNYVASAEKNIEAAKLYQQNERTANNNAFYAQNINKQPGKVEGFVKSATDNAANRNTLIAQMETYKGWGSKIK
jgi:hypothetical protein